MSNAKVADAKRKQTNLEAYLKKAEEEGKLLESKPPVKKEVPKSLPKPIPKPPV